MWTNKPKNQGNPKISVLLPWGLAAARENFFPKEGGRIILGYFESGNWQNPNTLKDKNDVIFTPVLQHLWLR